MQLAGIAWLLALSAAAAVDTLVVCPQSFQPAMRPWIEYRQSQGHDIQVLDASGSAEEIRRRIHRAAEHAAPRFILLVGDADPGALRDATRREHALPTHYAEAKVNIHYGSQPQIATDNPYADLDGDQLPDVALGRITADSASELNTIIHKIIKHERSAPRDDRRRQVHFVAGTSGFGALVDSALETATRSILRDHIPATHASTMTYANWRSPYCPPPERIRGAAVARLNEGGLFWVYMGHSHVQFVEFLHLPAARHPVFDIYAIPQLSPASGSPIALFLACYAGAFDARVDCMAEEMLRAPGGPVAVIGGTRVTMPYAMSVLGMEMLGEYFDRRTDTLGELLLNAKRHSVLTQRDDTCRKSLDTVAVLVNPLGANLAEERAEHVLMFHLLGDPLLRLNHPPVAQVSLAAKAFAGEALDVTILSPCDGLAELELVVRRDRLTFEPAVRENYEDTPEAERQFSETYRRANDGRLSVQHAMVHQGELRTRLSIPQDAQGPCHVRVTIHGEARFALARPDLLIERR